MTSLLLQHVAVSALSTARTISESVFALLHQMDQPPISSPIAVGE